MTHVWMSLLGPDPGSPVGKISFIEHIVNEVHAGLRRSMPGFEGSVNVWIPFQSEREYRGQQQLIVLIVGDWREFTKRDYFLASNALALHESGAVRLIPVFIDRVDA